RRQLAPGQRGEARDPIETPDASGEIAGGRDRFGPALQLGGEDGPRGPQAGARRIELAPDLGRNRGRQGERRGRGEKIREALLFFTPGPRLRDRAGRGAESEQGEAGAPEGGAPGCGARRLGEGVHERGRYSTEDDRFATAGRRLGRPSAVARRGRRRGRAPADAPGVAPRRAELVAVLLGRDPRQAGSRRPLLRAGGSLVSLGPQAAQAVRAARSRGPRGDGLRRA